MSTGNAEQMNEAKAKKTSGTTTIKVEATYDENYRKHPDIKQSRTILLMILYIEMVKVEFSEFIDP